jgi:hypothetical protein
MGLSVKAGTITSPAGTGQQTYDTGLGEVLKAIIFIGDVDGTVDTWQSTFDMVLGCATAADDEWAIGTISLDNAGSGDCATIFVDDACLVGLTNATTNGYKANLISFGTGGDAGKFTLDWTARAATGTAYLYIALAGTDIANAKAGTFVVPSSGGTASITDPGFRPTALMVAHCDVATASPNTVVAHLSHALGFFDGTSNACLNVTSEDGVTTMDTYRTLVATMVLRMANRATGVEDAAAAGTAFTPTGFDISISNNPPSDLTAAYLAFDGAQFKIGTDTQAATDTTKQTSGAAFTPKGLLLTSVSAVTDTAIVAHNRLSTGWYDGAANRVVFSDDEDNVGNAVTARRYSESKSIIHAVAAATHGSSTLVGTASVSSLDPGGFTLSWADTDGAAYEFIYAMIGAASLNAGWKRLVGPTRPSGAAATLYTVPTNRRTVIRHIHAYNPGGGSVNLTVSIGTDAAATRILDAFPVAEDVPFDDYKSRYALAEGETIQAFASTADRVVLTIHGEELTL